MGNDDIISTIVYLIPVAVVIFLRAFAVKRKADAAKREKIEETAALRRLQERAEAFEKKEGTAAPLSRVSGREPEEEWQPHWLEKGEEKRPPSPAPKAPEREGGAESRPPEPDLGVFAPSLGAREHAPLPDIVYSSQASPGPAPRMGAPRPSAFRFPPFLERLPPLKKAVALSEILGRPRSLEDEESRR